MREIKFRAACHPPGSKYVLVLPVTIGTDRVSFIREDGVHAYHCNNLGFDDPQLLGIMQYTGLLDKNGVEIYEGDIIKAKHNDGLYDIGEVVYGHKGAFCISLPKVATGIKSPLLNYMHGIMFNEFDIEVIGNIWKNPELLEAKL